MAAFELIMLLVVRGRVRTPAAGPFCLFLLLNLLWVINYALDLRSDDLAEKAWLLQLRSTFLPFYVLVWFETAIRFVLGRPFLRGWILAAGLVVPIVTMVLYWIPGLDQLVYHSPRLDQSGALTLLRVSAGPWGHVYNMFNYVVGVAAMIVVLRTPLRRRGERMSRMLFFGGAMLGILADALFEFNLSPTPGLNYAPLILPLTTGLMAWSLLGGRMSGLTPVARAALVERLHAGLLVFDREEHLIDVNPAAANVLGRSPESLIGRPAAEVLASHLELLGFLRAPGGEARREFVVGNRILEGSTFMIGTGDAARARVLALNDVTAQKQTEEQLRLARDAAEAAESAQSRFLAMMSHEIRTPMNGVLGFAQLLSEMPMPAEQREYIDLIEQNGRALLVIINDVLDYSKIAAGELRIEHIQCDVPQIVRQVCRMLESSAHSKGIELICQVAPDFPSQVLSDPVRIGQIISNLLGNAVKFTAKGSVSIELEFEESGPASRMAMHIRDTGIGIHPDVQERMFQPFSQADASISRRFGGTGLGLAISRTLCEMMGGSLTVESAPGRGSVFTATVATGEALSVDLLREGAAHGGRALGVLVVEDNAVNQVVIRAMLTRLGHRVRITADGTQALSALSEEAFDVVLMDIEMPVMDGLETVRRMREAEAAGGVRRPVIAVTAHALAGERERCLAAGMDDFLTKPVTVQALRAALQRLDPAAAPATE